MSADSPPMYDSSVQTGFIGAYFLSLCNAVLGGLFLVLFLLMPPPNSIITPHCGAAKKKKEKEEKDIAMGGAEPFHDANAQGAWRIPGLHISRRSKHSCINQLALTVKAAKSSPLMQHLI